MKLVFAELLALLNGQLADYDDAIAQAVQRHPDAPIFASFPGVGPVGTAVLLAEIGEDRDHYPTAGTLLAEAGLAPVTRSSGRSHRVRFRYAANTRLREAVMWWAYNSLKESPWAAEAYQQARTRGQHHYRALRGLGARSSCGPWGVGGTRPRRRTRPRRPSDGRSAPRSAGAACVRRSSDLG